MAKRFSDSEKWNDVWFSELDNNYKVIWIYLLDTCDNAGIFNLNIKQINFNCSTNISVEEFINLFQNRITQVSKDKWLINKFCSFQYGNDFLNSKNKAVQAAISKLVEVGYVINNNNTYTLSIGYKYPIDTPKEKEKEKEEEKDKDKDKVKEKIKEEEKEKIKDKFEFKTKEQKEEMSKEELEQYYIQLDIYSKTIK